MKQTVTNFDYMQNSIAEVNDVLGMLDYLKLNASPKMARLFAIAMTDAEKLLAFLKYVQECRNEELKAAQDAESDE